MSCGIGFVVNMGQNNGEVIKRVVKKLLLELQSRGEHATGVAALHLDSEDIIKGPLKADEFVLTEKFNKFMDDNKDAKAFMLHTRAATQGDPQININNHPIISRNYIVIHNGMIRDDAEEVLNELPDEVTCLWDKQVEVDSYIINKVCEIYGPKAVSSIEGTIATVIYDRKRKNIWFYSNKSDSFSVGYSDRYKLLICASTANAIKAALSSTEYLYGIIEYKRDEDKTLVVSELPQNVLFYSSLKAINFKRIHQRFEFRDHDLEEMLNPYYNCVILKWKNNKVVVFITETVKNKVLNALSKKFQSAENDEYWIVERDRFNEFIKTISVHKQKKQYVPVSYYYSNYKGRYVY